MTLPQHYHNTLLSDRYDEGGFFIRFSSIVLALLDRSDDAVCTGTGLLARRHAVDAIGQFPTESVAEGVLTSSNIASEDEKRSLNLTYVNRLGHALSSSLALPHCAVLIFCSTGATSWIYYILSNLPSQLSLRPVDESYPTMGVLWPRFVLIWPAYIANA